jgi:hypothetical protein
MEQHEERGQEEDEIGIAADSKMRGRQKLGPGACVCRKTGYPWAFCKKQE